MQQICIGTVKGPGETPNEFTVIAPDPERRVKHGEFVYYQAQVDGEERPILGRITARRAVKLYPDGFMADPNVPPREIAALFGFDSQDDELFELTVTVLGYHSAAFGDFHQPARAARRRGRGLHRRCRLLDRSAEQAAQGRIGQRAPGQPAQSRGRCRARGAGRARAHLDPSGHYRLYRQRQELSGRRAVGGADDALQPRWPS